jgi:hypothetical protein
MLLNELQRERAVIDAQARRLAALNGRYAGLQTSLKSQAASIDQLTRQMTAMRGASPRPAPLSENPQLAAR